MTVKRLRPAYSGQELGDLYRDRYDHTRWPEHVRRIEVTAGLGRAILQTMAIVEWQLADLSCGDSALVDALSANQHEPWRGDICDIEIGGLDLLGPIEETIDQIPHVDLFILSETLEHLDDPAMVLRKIRAKADRLLMSTPIHSDDMLDANPEHYWQWDYADLKAMLLESGWTADHTVVLGGPAWYYTYFIAGCS